VFRRRCVDKGLDEIRVSRMRAVMRGLARCQGGRHLARQRNTVGAKVVQIDRPTELLQKRIFGQLQRNQVMTLIVGGDVMQTGEPTHGFRHDRASAWWMFLRISGVSTALSRGSLPASAAALRGCLFVPPALRESWRV